MKPEMIEGPKAAANFTDAMKKIFRVLKSEIKKAEKKSRSQRRPKKRN